MPKGWGVNLAHSERGGPDEEPIRGGYGEGLARRAGGRVLCAGYRLGRAGHRF